MTLSGAYTAGQNRPESNGNERVLHIPQSSKAWASPSDYLMSHLGYSLGWRSYPQQRCSQYIRQPQPTGLSQKSEKPTKDLCDRMCSWIYPTMLFSDLLSGSLKIWLPFFRLIGQLDFPVYITISTIYMEKLDRIRTILKTLNIVKGKLIQPEFQQSPTIPFFPVTTQICIYPTPLQEKGATQGHF